jgi:hypothetical protein
MAGYVYLVRNGDLHKIGRTDNLERRLQQLQPDEVIQVLETDRSRDLEHELHKEFQSKRLPQTEYFRLDEAEINAARIELGWDPEGPVVLPTPLPTMLDRAIDAARDGAHLSLGAVALTVVAFWGEGALAGHGFVLDLGVGLLAMATLLAFLAASAALLATALNYGSLLVWQRIKAKEVKPTPTQTTKP